MLIVVFVKKIINIHAWSNSYQTQREDSMLNRKTVKLALMLVLLVSSLSACAAGSAVNPPSRDVTVSVDEALAAQNAGMAGMMGGKVDWTESQFSSFLTVLLQQNTGPIFRSRALKPGLNPITRFSCVLN